MNQENKHTEPVGVDIPRDPHQPEEIINAVETGLTYAYPDNEMRQIFDAARGDSPDGFVQRLADKLDSTLDKSGFDREESSEYTKTTYEELKTKFDEVRYLPFRNVFRSMAKLELDIEAYKQGQPGANGQEVSGGQIALDVIELLRGDIIVSAIERELWERYNEKYPSVDMEASDVSKEEPKPEAGAGLIEPERNIDDNGYVHDLASVDKQAAAENRIENPSFGFFMGADMLVEPKEISGMKVWPVGNGFKENVEVGNSIDTMYINPVRLVEHRDTHYLVSPFGQVLAADKDTPVEKIQKLDITGYNKTAGMVEAYAKEQGMTVDQAKGQLSDRAIENYIETVSSRIDATAQYIVDKELPFMQDMISDYKENLDIIQEERRKIEIDDSEHADVGKLKEYEKALETAIDKAEDRIVALEGTLAKYTEVTDALSGSSSVQEKLDICVDAERTAAGRTDEVSFMDQELDTEISDTVASINEGTEVEAIEAHEPDIRSVEGKEKAEREDDAPAVADTQPKSPSEVSAQDVGATSTEKDSPSKEDILEAYSNSVDTEIDYYSFREDFLETLPEDVLLSSDFQGDLKDSILAVYETLPEKMSDSQIEKLADLTHEVAVFCDGSELANLSDILDRMSASGTAIDRIDSFIGAVYDRVDARIMEQVQLMQDDIEYPVFRIDDVEYSITEGNVVKSETGEITDSSALVELLGRFAEDKIGLEDYQVMPSSANDTASFLQNEIDNIDKLVDDFWYEKLDDLYNQPDTVDTPIDNNRFEDNDAWSDFESDAVGIDD